MENTKNKKMIDAFLKRVAIHARIGVIEGEYGETEIAEFIADRGSEYYSEMMDMQKAKFMILLLTEVLNDIKNADVEELEDILKG